MIGKGILAAGLLAQVTVAKHDDHPPLYRQTELCARSGVHIPRSSMARGHVGATSQTLGSASAACAWRRWSQHSGSTSSATA